jgi:hypothetical protein
MSIKEKEKNYTQKENECEFLNRNEIFSLYNLIRCVVPL